MKVRLASQLLSESVATAIAYCEKENVPKFQGSAATVRFIKLFNKLFDILNSRNQQYEYFKKPISNQNCHNILKFLDIAKEYILSLQVSKDGIKIIDSSRKTGFLGFLICIESVKNLFMRYVKSNDGGLVYLPIYKLSQDHTELLFQKICFHGGWNNNPTARQFSAAYKKLLIHSEIKNSYTGNCIPLEDIKILTSTSIPIPPGELINITTQGHRIVDDQFESLSYDHDYDFQPRILSLISSEIVRYISGSVVSYLSEKLKCEFCISALHSKTPDPGSFISFKSRGKLVHPSRDVYLICKRCESVFRENVNHGKEKSLTSEYNILKTEILILRELCNASIFQDLFPHSCGGILDNHALLLTRSIIKRYLFIRLLYWGKNIVNKSNSIRNLYNKLIFFKRQ